MFRFILLILVLAVGFMIWGLVYFYHTMTVGDTKGLREKLESLDGVASVENYKVYEGNAFFSLILSQGGYLTLGGVGNVDLISFDGVVVKRVGANKIICKKDNSSIQTVGVSTHEIQRQYMKDKNLNNISELIDNYNHLDELFSKMPLTFKSSISYHDQSVNSSWVCSSQRESRTPKD